MTSSLDTFELSDNGNTVVIVCNRNLLGSGKWFFYDKSDPSVVIDPTTKSEAVLA